jgi:hypothetical protein
MHFLSFRSRAIREQLAESSTVGIAKIAASALAMSASYAI